MGNNSEYMSVYLEAADVELQPYNWSRWGCGTLDPFSGQLKPFRPWIHSSRAALHEFPFCVAKQFRP
jgi:hypothetical protein